MVNLVSVQNTNSSSAENNDNTKIKKPVIPISKRTRCEVYARIVGYMRPVNQWNDGKQSEFNDRKTFDKSIK